MVHNFYYFIVCNYYIIHSLVSRRNVMKASFWSATLKQVWWTRSTECNEQTKTPVKLSPRSIGLPLYGRYYFIYAKLLQNSCKQIFMKLLQRFQLCHVIMYNIQYHVWLLGISQKWWKLELLTKYQLTITYFNIIVLKAQ